MRVSEILWTFTEYLSDSHWFFRVHASENLIDYGFTETEKQRASTSDFFKCAHFSFHFRRVPSALLSPDSSTISAKLFHLNQRHQKKLKRSGQLKLIIWISLALFLGHGTSLRYLSWRAAAWWHQRTMGSSAICREASAHQSKTNHLRGSDLKMSFKFLFRDSPRNILTRIP